MFKDFEIGDPIYSRKENRLGHIFDRWSYKGTDYSYTVLLENHNKPVYHDNDYYLESEPNADEQMIEALESLKSELQLA